MTGNRPHAIPAVAVAILLLIALSDQPYGYYTFLRWSVTIAAGVVAWCAFRSSHEPIAWVFVGIAVLFNPVAPIYLDRATWRPIDVIAAIAFLLSLKLQIVGAAAPEARAAGDDRH